MEVAPFAWRDHFILALGSLVVFAGCTSDSARRHPEAEGWVGARITQIEGSLRSPMRPYDDCRQNATDEVRYAEVGFLWHKSSRRRIARLPADGIVMHKGDFVYVNVQDCNMPLAPHD
jgi:hypothetical protein